jgi:hypothetical protein
VTTGVRWKWDASIHCVVNGNSDRQNSRARFAHKIAPVTRAVSWNMWW